MNIYCYLLYKTHKNQGAFRVRVDPEKLKEIVNYSSSLPVNEYGEACDEFSRCLLKLDQGVNHTQIFKDSIISHEIMAYYLLSSSEQIKYMMNMQQYDVLHCTYHFDTKKSDKHAIKESIYPGPNHFAPEEAVQAWLSQH